MLGPPCCRPAGTDLLASLEAARRNILRPHGLGEAVEDRTVDQFLNGEMVQVFGITSWGVRPSSRSSLPCGCRWIRQAPGASEYPGAFSREAAWSSQQVLDSSRAGRLHALPRSSSSPGHFSRIARKA